MRSERAFGFRSCATLERLTGARAFTLAELRRLVLSCSDSSLFYHTFSAFRRLREIGAPHTNDFAAWISTSLNEEALAEKLTAVGLGEHRSVRNLRNCIVRTIDQHRGQKPSAFRKRADDPFCLFDVTRIVYPANGSAHDLGSFRAQLETVSEDSLCFHLIEARLGNRLMQDDFSMWIKGSLDLPGLAEQIRRLDITGSTVEGLRFRLCQVIDDYLARQDRTDMADRGRAPNLATRLRRTGT